MLRKQPPQAVAQVLRDRGVDPESLQLCTDSDIDLLGRYYPQWLVVSDSRLFVLHEEGGKAEVVRELTGREVSAPETVDLRAIISDHARALGVHHISQSPSCTRCDNDRFFSHRAGDPGRQVGVIMAS